jgi:hypothetical protein
LQYAKKKKKKTKTKHVQNGSFWEKADEWMLATLLSLSVLDIQILRL